jgi:hypothetical protein
MKKNDHQSRIGRTTLAAAALLTLMATGPAVTQDIGSELTETEQCDGFWNGAHARNHCTATITGSSGGLAGSGIDSEHPLGKFHCEVTNVNCSLAVTVEEGEDTETHTLTATASSLTLTPLQVGNTELCVSEAQDQGSNTTGGYTMRLSTSSPACTSSEYTSTWVWSNNLPDLSPADTSES